MVRRQRIRSWSQFQSPSRARNHQATSSDTRRSDKTGLGGPRIEPGECLLEEILRGEDRRRRRPDRNDVRARVGPGRPGRIEDDVEGAAGGRGDLVGRRDEDQAPHGGRHRRARSRPTPRVRAAAADPVAIAAGRTARAGSIASRSVTARWSNVWRSRTAARARSAWARRSSGWERKWSTSERSSAAPTYPTMPPSNSSGAPRRHR